jgi:hypothetical protein
MFTEPEPEKPAVVPWAEPEQVRRTEAFMAEQEEVREEPVIEEPEPVVEEPVEVEAQPSLIEAIPIMSVKPAEEYDAEYEQILKDLDDIRNTILHRQVGPSLVMEDKDGNLVDLTGPEDERGPQFVPGLHLKKLMEKDQPK